MRATTVQLGELALGGIATATAYRCNDGRQAVCCFCQVRCQTQRPEGTGRLLFPSRHCVRHTLLATSLESHRTTLYHGDACMWVTWRVRWTVNSRRTGRCRGLYVLIDRAVHHSNAHVKARQPIHPQTVNDQQLWALNRYYADLW